MAFYDALFDDAVIVNGVAARRADTGSEIRSALGRGDAVIITELGLLDLIVVRPLDLLIDARMQKYDLTPDLRPLARLTVGVGPGFGGGANCHAAIETRPGKVERVLEAGSTDAGDGVPRRLGGRGEERFIRAENAGRWHTAIEIGTRVFKDFAIGHLGHAPRHSTDSCAASFATASKCPPASSSLKSIRAAAGRCGAASIRVPVSSRQPSSRRSRFARPPSRKGRRAFFNL